MYELFDSIEEAIEQNLKLSFNYARYNTFGKKVIDENELHIVSPLYIRLRNFTYYLFCSENEGDTSAEYRFDRIENLTIIDDSYNSNPISSKSALDTLAEFEGTKIIVTPGLIELGDDEIKYNYCKTVREAFDKYLKDATVLVETTPMENKIRSLEMLKKEGFIP